MVVLGRFPGKKDLLVAQDRLKAGHAARKLVVGGVGDGFGLRGGAWFQSVDGAFARPIRQEELVALGQGLAALLNKNPIVAELGHGLAQFPVSEQIILSRLVAHQNLRVTKGELMDI